MPLFNPLFVISIQRQSASSKDMLGLIVHSHEMVMYIRFTIQHLASYHRFEMEMDKTIK